MGFDGRQWGLLTETEALYTVAKLPRPISSCRLKGPIAISGLDVSFGLLDVEDEDRFSAMVTSQTGCN